MTLPEVVSRAEWLAARKGLLAHEKALTRATDALNAQRRQLPMVRVDVEYRFDGRRGPVTLLDLFAGRSQLAVYHFMFDPSWDAGCPGCTAVVDAMAPALGRHLGSRDTSLAIVSLAPLVKLDAYRVVRGWELDWLSSYGTSFNVDFGVTIDAEAAPGTFDGVGADSEHVGRSGGAMNERVTRLKEISALSFFLRDGDDVFHTYTTYQRGTEGLISAYHLLDLSPLGRQEQWELPAGRVASPGPADPSFGGWGPGGPGAPSVEPPAAQCTCDD